MQGGYGWRGQARLVSIAAALVMATTTAESEDQVRNVRLVNNSHRFAVTLALTNAARQLDQPECQGLLDEFASTTGQPLRDQLSGLGFSAPDYLRSGVFFYDAPERICGTSNLALTQPGSRAIFVCGPRVVREMKRNSRHVEAILIHELLHSLGLGENPPSSDYITSRVQARCGERGKVTAAKPASDVRLQTPQP